MADKRKQQVRALAKARKFFDELRPESIRVRRSKVRKPSVFRVCPHALVGVELGRVAGELLSDDLRVPGKIFPHNSRPVVRVSR